MRLRYFNVILMVIIITVVETQTQWSEDPHCFRFTWLGPNYNTESNFSGTCEDLRMGANVPCTSPLMSTDNSRLPNTTNMWNLNELNRTAIACRMTPGNVCVKYSYYYNKAVENITYMCTKVKIENEGAVTKNCYTEYQNGREIEVCICRSSYNDVPCNTGNLGFNYRLGFIFVILFKLILFQNKFVQ